MKNVEGFRRVDALSISTVYIKSFGALKGLGGLTSPKWIPKTFKVGCLIKTLEKEPRRTSRMNVLGGGSPFVAFRGHL